MSARKFMQARLPLIYVNFSMGHPSAYMNISMLSAGLVGGGGGGKGGHFKPNASCIAIDSPQGAVLMHKLCIKYIGAWTTHSTKSLQQV
jgi:hypothetical protein